jgi:hypothetical protein
VRGLKVGIPRDYFFHDINPEVGSAFEAAMGTLRQQGTDVREVKIPSIWAAPAFMVIMLTEAFSYHARDLRERPQLYGEVLREKLMAGGLFTADEYVQAQRLRARLRADMHTALGDVDVLATPTAPITAPAFSAVLDPNFPFARSNMAPFNMSGLPTLALPCGFASNGLPVSLQPDVRSTRRRCSAPDTPTSRRPTGIAVVGGLTRAPVERLPDVPSDGRVPAQSPGSSDPGNWRNCYTRWAFHHVREIVPTADIPNDPAGVMELPASSIDLRMLTIASDRGEPVSLGKVLHDTSTDGLVVLHRGRLVYEYYANGLTPTAPHILMSVSKSLLGLLAGILVGRGVLEPDRRVTDVVPEVAGTAYEGATIRHLLDMRVGIEFDEDYLAASGPMIYARRRAGNRSTRARLHRTSGRSTGR